MVNPYEVAVTLAERLTAAASPKKAIFVTTGAEAVENCVKIARAHTGRRGVIAFNGGFHGRTNLTMTLTGKVTPYKNLFGPFPADIFHAPFPMERHDVSVKDSLKALQNLFKVDICPTDVAAIIVEPVQGEGGLPVACAAVLEVIEEENLVQRSVEIGVLFNKRLSQLQQQHPDAILDVRNQGAMIAIGFVKNGDPEQANTQLTQDIITNAAQHGLVLLACGFYGNVIRFLPALTISDEVTNEGLDNFIALFESRVVAPEENLKVS